MSEESKQVFWRHRFERQSGSFKFFCSSCHASAPAESGSEPRLTQISEDLLRDYLRETGGESISCSGCGETLVNRESPPTR